MISTGCRLTASKNRMCDERLYSVPVTDLDGVLIASVQHYRDRADCENNLDELKNQWGWGGYTTQDLSPCRLMARIIALIYNCWSLFVRLPEPHMHKEAITSRPLLLSSVARLAKLSKTGVEVLEAPPNSSSFNKAKSPYDHA